MTDQRQNSQEEMVAASARRRLPLLAAAAFALLLLLDRCGVALSYFADWSAVTKERFDDEPTCVPIPRNLSLCHGIGYTKVRGWGIECWWCTRYLPYAKTWLWGNCVLIILVPQLTPSILNNNNWYS